MQVTKRQEANNRERERRMKCSKTQRMGVGQRIGPYIREVRLGEWGWWESESVRLKVKTNPI